MLLRFFTLFCVQVDIFFAIRVIRARFRVNGGEKTKTGKCRPQRSANKKSPGTRGGREPARMAAADQKAKFVEKAKFVGAVVAAWSTTR